MEVNPETPYPVVVDMPEVSQTVLGGTMRLGLRRSDFVDGTEGSSKARKYNITHTHTEATMRVYPTVPSNLNCLDV